MNPIEQIQDSFFRLYRQEDNNLRQIALKTGVDYSTLHKLKTGKSSFAHMSFSTVLKLFPGLKVSGLDDSKQSSLSPMQQSQGNYIDQQELENQILHDDHFTAEERVKFLLWLKDKINNP